MKHRRKNLKRNKSSKRKPLSFRDILKARGGRNQKFVQFLMEEKGLSQQSLEPLLLFYDQVKKKNPTIRLTHLAVDNGMVSKQEVDAFERQFIRKKTEDDVMIKQVKNARKEISSVIESTSPSDSPSESTQNQRAISVPPSAVDPEKAMLIDMLELVQRDTQQFNLSVYRVLQEGFLGAGGMGSVKKVTTRIGSSAALKSPHQESYDESSFRRFMREARFTAYLTHRTIPPVFSYGIDADNMPFMLMKEITGNNVEELLEKTFREDLSKEVYDKHVQKMLRIIIQVAEGLSYAHSKRIIHRDIKPSNIQVDENDQVIILDWGLAKYLGKDQEFLKFSEEEEQDILTSYRLDVNQASRENLGLTHDEDIVGTLGYMAPEQADRQYDMNEQTDIYALGALLCHMLCGKAPVQAPNAMEALAATVNGQLELPISVNKNVPLELNSIVAKCLSLDPRERYKACQDFIDDIRRFQEREQVIAHHYGFIDHFREDLKENAMRNLGVILLFMVLSSLGVMAAKTSLEYDKEQIAQSVKNKQFKLKKQAETQKKEVDDQLMKTENERKKVIKYYKTLKKLNTGNVLTEKKYLKQQVSQILSEFPRESFTFIAAEVYFKNNLYDEAIILLEKIIKENPPAYKALYLLHQIELEQAKKNIKEKPDDSDIKWEYTMVYTPAIKKLIAEARRRGDKNEFVYLYDAYKAVLKNASEMKTLVDLALQQNHRLLRAYYLAIYGFYIHKEYKNMYLYIDKLLKIDPSLRSLEACLKYAYLGGNYKKSIYYSNIALKKKSTHLKALYVKADSYTALKRYSDSYNSWVLIHRILGDKISNDMLLIKSVIAIKAGVKSYDIMKDLEEARQKTLRLTGFTREKKIEILQQILNQKYLFLRSVNDYKAIIRLSTKHIESPTNILSINWLLFERARAYIFNKEFEKGVAELKEVERRTKTMHQETRYLIGFALEEQGNYKEALACYKQAINLAKHQKSKAILKERIKFCEEKIK